MTQGGVIVDVTPPCRPRELYVLYSFQQTDSQTSVLIFTLATGWLLSVLSINYRPS